MQSIKRKLKWIIVLSTIVLAVSGGFAIRYRGSDPPTLSARADELPRSRAQSVEWVRPTSGGMVRKTVQPGSAHSFQHADLYSKVSGFLKTQNVDIGSRVHCGDLLAEIEAPELPQSLERAMAQQRQAEAEVHQNETNVTCATAEHAAAEAYISQCEADVLRAEADRAYCEKQLDRIRDLHARNSIEERLVDERLDKLQAARGGELAAQRAVNTAKEQAASAKAKITRAEADLLVAKARRQVAEAEVARARVFVSYLRIISPYDGVVTARNFHPGDFVRAADHGGQVPVLCVARTDLVRVVVQVPDRDVPYTQPGDRAIVQFDALAEAKFVGAVSRISASENRESRTMRVEIDVPNPDGLICAGMYGQVEIALDEGSQGVTIPSACLVGDVRDHQARVFVVDGTKARLIGVRTGHDTGAQVEVTSGLSTSAEVVLKPPIGLNDGGVVDPSAAATARPTSR